MFERKETTIEFKKKKFVVGSLNTLQTINFRSRMNKADVKNDEIGCIELMTELIINSIAKPKVTKKMIEEGMDFDDMQDLFIEVCKVHGFAVGNVKKGKTKASNRTPSKKKSKKK